MTDPEKKKEGEGKEKEPSADELRAQLEAERAKREAAEKAMRDTQAEFTPMRQKIAEMERLQAEASKGQTLEQWLASVKAKAEEDPTGALTDAMSALAYQEHQNREAMRQELAKLRQEMQDEILKANPETAKLLDGVSKIQGATSKADQIRVLRELMDGARGNGNGAAARDLEVAGSAEQAKRNKREKSLAEQVSDDPNAQRAMAMLGLSEDDVGQLEKKDSLTAIHKHFAGK